jgi:hypothetical protein
MWDPRVGKRIGKIVAHTDNIRAALISEDSRCVRRGVSPQFATLRAAHRYLRQSTSTSTVPTRDVLLVLRLSNGSAEAPLDPARRLTVTAASSDAQRYVFHATHDDAEFALKLPVIPETADVELFHRVLVGYAADVHAPAGEAHSSNSNSNTCTPSRPPHPHAARIGVLALL